MKKLTFMKSLRIISNSGYAATFLIFISQFTGFAGDLEKEETSCETKKLKSNRFMERKKYE